MVDLSRASMITGIRPILIDEHWNDALIVSVGECHARAAESAAHNLAEPEEAESLSNNSADNSVVASFASFEYPVRATIG